MFALTAIIKKEFRGNTEEEKVIEINAERLSAILVKLTEADELMGSDEEEWRISGGHAGLVNRAMEYGYHSNPVGWSIQRLVIKVNGVEISDPQYEKCADFINEAIY
tara:strand:+ start:63 stop:383 length:321 start_codon:yes stop_codon:yes gene_type:complete